MTSVARRSDNAEKSVSAPRSNRGPFASEQEALSHLVERLVEALDPEQVWLFGSRAENRHRPDSDFDLMVVTRANADNGDCDHDAVYKPVLGLGIGCDIVPCRADDFQRAINDPTSLSWHVVRSGRKLHERA